MNCYYFKSRVFTSSILDQKFIEHAFLNESNILVVTSPSISGFSKYANFIGKLMEKYNVSEYTNIAPDAPLQDLEYIVDTYKKPDIIIGVGGGSVIDSVKALSIGWNGVRITDFFYGNVQLPNTKIKTIAIPTTGGTGAELSFGAIIFDKNKNLKGGLRGEILQPEYVVIDVDLYLNAPQKLIAETGFDCFTHAVETYLSKASSPVVKYQSICAIDIFFKHFSKAVQKDRKSMEKMAIASSLMGVNLALSSTCLPHRIQYSLRKFQSHSHAQGLICLYKGWLPEVKESKEFQFMVDNLGLSKIEFQEKVDIIKKTLKIDYSLIDFGFDPKDIPEIAKNVTGNLALDPIYQDENTIIQILKNSFK